MKLDGGLKHEIRCPACGRVLMTVDFAGAPFVRARAAQLARERVAAALEKARKRGALDTAQRRAVRARAAAVSAEDLAPELERCRAAWRKAAADGHAVHCVPCDETVELVPDDGHALGVRARARGRPSVRPATPRP